VSQIDALPERARGAAPTWLLLPHCTERTNAPQATSDWKRVADRVGVDLCILASGCCGMAGLYGHEAANRRTSEDIYVLSWAAHVANPHHAGRLLATGYSCRSQVKLMDGVAVVHPIQLLLAQLRTPDRGSARDRDVQSVDYLSAHHEEY
jgi:Fe-S oxidoreductase